MTDFIANASHELRTPVSIMKTAVETLLESKHLSMHDRRILEVLSKNVTRLEELVQDLLDLNYVESPNLKVQFEHIDLELLLRDIEYDLHERIAQKGITVKAEFAAAAIWADRKLLRLVLTNLVDNAVKFSSPREPRIEVRSYCRDDLATVEVQDNGIGISPEDMERVFERFFQVDKTRNQGGQSGSGLGLTIVKHAMAAMGGSVNLESATGEGTLTRLNWPQPQNRT